jgi:hypothetical protein
VRLNNYILSVTPQDFDLRIPEQPIEPLDDQLILNDALQHPSWTTAMNDELHSIAKNQTYDLVELPPSKRPISAK